MRDDIHVLMIAHPEVEDWLEVKRRALVTIGKNPISIPTREWMMDLLECEHSPIRYLQFSFLLEVPYWVHAELARHHEGCEKYVRSQRNDRQGEYDRNAARQDTPVTMIWDMNAQALINICRKRLCMCATPEARQVMEMIRHQVYQTNPEFIGFLVPECEYRGGVCHEYKGCGRYTKINKT